MAGLKHSQLRRIDTSALRAYAERLNRWSSRPLRQANVIALFAPLLSMMWLVQLTLHVADRTAILRVISLVFIALHAARHWWTIRVFTNLSEQGLMAAATALAAYRDPRRLSNLDLAAAWLAFAAATPFLSSISASP